MEFMAAPQCFHHLPCFKVIQTNCARVLVVFVAVRRVAAFARLLLCARRLIGICCRVLLLFVFEAWNWVYDIFYFFWRPNRLPVFVHLLPIFIVVLVSVLLEELLVGLIHAGMTAHSIYVDSWESCLAHILLSCLSVEKYLLSLSVGLELVTLTTTCLVLWSTKYLPAEIHLYRWIAL